MSALDNECPRCHGKGIASPVQPAPAPTPAPSPMYSADSRRRYVSNQDVQPDNSGKLLKGILWALAAIPITAFLIVMLLVFMGSPVKNTMETAPSTSVNPIPTSMPPISTVAPVEAPEIAMARSVATGLINGDVSVENLIDWPVFKFMGEDLGQPYNAMSSEAARANARKRFITDGLASFQSEGLTIAALTNWRIYSQDTGGTTVACDTPKGAKFLWTISKNKLTSLQGANKS